MGEGETALFVIEDALDIIMKNQDGVFYYALKVLKRMI